MADKLAKTTPRPKSTDSSDKLNPTQTFGISVPVGHIVVNSRWKGSNLVSDLQVSIPVHFEDSTSAIDFYPACKSGAIYVSEADMIEGCAYKRRLARLRKANKVHGVVIAERTDMSQQYFNNLQKFSVNDLGLDLVPVANQNEAAAFLIQLVYAESSLTRNPFLKTVQSPCKDTAILRTIGKCPGIGETKSLAILEKFPRGKTTWPFDDSIVSNKELASVIGKASATKLFNFLRGTS